MVLELLPGTPWLASCSEPFQGFGAGCRLLPLGKGGAAPCRHLQAMLPCHLLLPAWWPCTLTVCPCPNTCNALAQQPAGAAQLERPVNVEVI